MAEAYLRFDSKDRIEILRVAATESGRPVHLLEKDIWVVWALGALFGNPLGDHLVFKGGTSLSKVYRAIRRFSEDVDLTYDIRRLVPELVGETGDALPTTRSEERRWTKAVRKQLPEWVKAEALPVITSRIEAEAVPARAIADKDKIFLEYEPLVEGYGYVSSRVMLEFGSRSTGEPSEPQGVQCDAAPYVPGVEFPAAWPRAMLTERTFWEKATAIHVFCSEGRGGERFARHWYDLSRLDEAGFADRALADRSLASAVATHKSWFFPEKDVNGQAIDYAKAVAGGLKLVPQGASRERLGEDYAKMVEDGLLFDEAETFEDLMARTEKLEARVNAATGGTNPSAGERIRSTGRYLGSADGCA